MPAEDVSFTFDTKQFEQGMATIDKGMKGLKMGAGKMAKGVAMGMVAASAAIGIFKLAIKGARKLLQEMVSGMPEIGQAFKIAKDIFFRNFLFPIRKAVMPLLQRMLDWVRDHRAMFVKWGYVVVGIFQTMLKIGQKVINMLRRIWQGAARMLTRIFGVEIKRVGDLMNIMAFKISATIQFLTALLTPLFQKIGEIVAKVAEFGVGLIKDFFEGFSEGAPGALEQLGKVFDVIKSLFQALVDINNETGVFTLVMKTLGAVLGGTLMQALYIIEGTIHGIIFALKSMVPAIGWVVQKLTPKAKRDEKLIARYEQQMGDLVRAEGEYYKGLWDRMKASGIKTGEAIVGAVEENPMVQERKTRLEQTPQNNFEVGQINVTAAEPDENKTKKVVEKVIDILSFQWNKEQETVGF